MPETRRRSFWVGPAFWLCLVMFVGLSVAIGWRIVAHLNVLGEPGLEDRWAWCDFRDAVYFPTQAFLNGENPYDLARYMARYPVEHNFPLYLPATLIVHLPFGALPYQVSEFLYGILIVVLTLGVASLAGRLAGIRASWTFVLGLSAAMLASRPGYWNLVLGQSAVTATLGTYLALRFAKSRAWLSGFGLTLAMLKPTFGLPLATAMLARREFRAVFFGGLLSSALVLAVIIPLSRLPEGLRGFFDSLIETQRYWAEIPVVSAVEAPNRIDATSVLSRLYGESLSGGFMLMLSGLIIVVSGLAIHRLHRRRVEERETLSGIVACYSIVACFYHQAYDLLVLVFPLVAFFGGSWSRNSSRLRWLRFSLGASVALAAANHFRTPAIVNRLGLTDSMLGVIEIFNGAVVFGGWILVVIVCFRARGHAETVLQER